MTTPTTQGKEEPRFETHFFNFDVRGEIPRDPLQEFSSSDMNDGKEEMLRRYQFTEMPGPGSPPLVYYASTFAQARFLAIAETGGYRFIVFITNEQALLAFRRKYDFAGALLPSMMMPPQPPAPDNVQMIKINTRVLRGS